MQVAVFSDIHDHEDNLYKAIKLVKERNIDFVLGLGDFCYPGITRIFVESHLRFNCVFGNNDGDKLRIYQESEKSEGRVVFADDDFDALTVDKKKVYITHYPAIARPVAKSGDYKAVFYGHDHQAFSQVLENGCLLSNPGELCGLKTGKASFGIWDTLKNEFQHVYL